MTKKDLYRKAGVPDVFMERGISFDGVIGVYDIGRADGERMAGKVIAFVKGA